MIKRKTVINPKKCIFCGKIFYIRDNQKPYQFAKQFCCSRQCNGRYIGKKYCTGKKAHNNRQQIKKCIWCGKEDMVSPCFANRPFCSQKCYAEYCSSGIRKGKNHPNWQGGKLSRYCLICGKKFFFDKGDLKRRPNSRRFCSISCKAIFYSKDEKNPNWRGGIQPLHLKIRNSRKAKEWKKQCLARDNHTCQICGKKKYLHIHHIKPFSTFPNLRFVLENGITLCKDCHYEIHYQLSKSKNRNRKTT